MKGSAVAKNSRKRWMVTTLQPATPGASARQARLGQGGSVLAENRLLRRGYERRPATPEQAPARARERRTGNRRRGTTLVPLGNALLPTWFSPRAKFATGRFISKFKRLTEIKCFPNQTPVKSFIRHHHVHE